MVNNGDNYLQTIHGQFSSRQIRGSNLYSTHTETIDELLSKLTNIQKYGHIDWNATVSQHKNGWTGMRNYS